MRDLLLPGDELMLVGMGVVFVFLLVCVTSLMSRLVNHFYRPAPVTPAAVSSPAAGEAVSAQTLAVIRDAIRQHRDRQKRSA